MKTLLKNLMLLVVSVTFAVAVAEGGSRFIMPVKYGNTLLALDGTPLPAYGGEEQLRPDLSYRVVSQEFDVIVTHTKEGYRGLTRPENPEVIFLGDSFTYGAGLNDKETIPHIYCRELDLVCVNLGVPGTATVTQVARLERYLTKYNWRPKHVKLMFMGMTSALMAGNDLNGNLEEMAARRAGGTKAPQQMSQTEVAKTLWEKVVAHRAEVLQHSNLVRIAYYIFGPMLRAKLSPASGSEQLKDALMLTGMQFRALDELAQHYGFAYSIHIIHPMQDVMSGGYTNTLAALKGIAGNAQVFSTAEALMAAPEILPQKYYYPMDGHLNVAGAQAIGLYLAAQDRARDGAPPAGQPSGPQ